MSHFVLLFVCIEHDQIITLHCLHIHLSSSFPVTRHNMKKPLSCFFVRMTKTDSLVPLIELYGQTDDFILGYVKRLHHFPWFQHTILCIEVPPPFHLIWKQREKENENPLRDASQNEKLQLSPKYISNRFSPLNNPGTSLYTMSWRVLSALERKNKSLLMFCWWWVHS